MRTVKMLVAQTEWLDGQLSWRDGQVVWTTEFGDVVPDAAALSQAQTCLKKIAGYRGAASFVLGDARGWLERKFGQLTLAKYLKELSGMDVRQLVQEARRHHSTHDPTLASQLCRLVVVEALCLNRLPASPGAALVVLGKPGVLPLQSLLNDGFPQTVRIFAAIVLGAIRKQHGLETLSKPRLSDVQIRQGYDWGRKRGLAGEAALAAAIIAGSQMGEKGGEIAERCEEAVKTKQAFSLPTAMLREMLAGGLSPVLVVELAEACVDAETVALRLLKARHELPDLDHRQERRRVAEARRAERLSVIASLEETIKAYVLASKDPVALRTMTAFLHKMLTLSEKMTPQSEATRRVMEQACDVMRKGLILSPAMQRAYWNLVSARHEDFWNPSSLTVGQPRRRLNWMGEWLSDVRTHYLNPLVTLLVATQSEAAVASAIDQGIMQEISGQKWTDPAIFQFCIALSAKFGMNGNHDFVSVIIRILSAFSDVGAARAYFQRLLKPLRGFSTATQIHVLEVVFSETGYTRPALHGSVPRFIPFFTSLARFAEDDNEEWCFCGLIVAASLVLVQTSPCQSRERIDWLASFLKVLSKNKERTYGQYQSLRTGVLLAAALATEDEAWFQQAIRLAARHHFRCDGEQIEAGQQFLVRFPALRSPLARLLLTQPRRVTMLLVRLGRTRRLPVDIHSRLEKLTPQATRDGVCFPIFLRPDTAWWKLHRRFPELAPTAHAYLHAQWLTGRPQTLPSGVQRALEKTERKTKELAALEKLLVVSPDRRDLAARAANIRQFLTSPSDLADETKEEVRERLLQAATEAGFAAIEHQVTDCYRHRLEAIAGPLPQSLVLTEDLVNASLLSADIQENRKLLLSLIRADVSNETNWREKHPANLAFLASATERGTDTQMWLSEFPKSYSCAGAAGKKVHLKLEKDPLHILQMGNYFDTCLSVGGVNAFSTVANACELNKRVIYARDQAGHVVGRKLIGINADGELVGFHTYCSLATEESNSALRRIFQSYVAAFATSCALKTAATGTVPTLFAEDWYDDGVVEWDENRSQQIGQPFCQYGASSCAPQLTSPSFP